MDAMNSAPGLRARGLGPGLAALTLATVAIGRSLVASARAAVLPTPFAGLLARGGALAPDPLLVSRSVCQPAAITAGSTILPPGGTSPSACATATDDGTYPLVWNNDIARCRPD